MGGNALKDLGTVRLPAKTALEIGERFSQSLIEVLPIECEALKP